MFKMVKNYICVCCSYSVCSSIYSSLIQTDPVPVWCVRGDYPYIIHGTRIWRRNVSLHNPRTHKLEKGRILTQSADP